jgi:crotonobetainyl-CoA:carnitine CoA-transferase CaiB-like acyl-CoA transferase
VRICCPVSSSTPISARPSNDLSDVFKTKTRDEWFEILTRHDICVGKVYDLDETAHDPHLQAREMISRSITRRRAHQTGRYFGQAV